MNNYWSDYCIVCASSDCDIVVENEKLKVSNRDIIHDCANAIKKLEKANEQLKDILKTIFDFCESDIFKKSNYVIYTPEQKQIIIDILKDNEC